MQFDKQFQDLFLYANDKNTIHTGYETQFSQGCTSCGRLFENDDENAIHCRYCQKECCPSCILFTHDKEDLENDDDTLTNFGGVFFTKGYIKKNATLFYDQSLIREFRNFLSHAYIEDDEVTEEIKKKCIRCEENLIHTLQEYNEKYKTFTLSSEKLKEYFKNCLYGKVIAEFFKLFGNNIACRECYRKQNSALFVSEGELINEIKKMYPEVYKNTLGTRILYK